MSVSATYGSLFQDNGTKKKGAKIYDTLANYKKFVSGWDFGQGEEIGITTISIAMQTCNVGFSYGLEVESHPTTNGGICLVFSLSPGIFFLDVYVNPDGTLDLREEMGIGADYEIIKDEKNVIFADVERALIETKTKCLTSGYYQSGDTPKKNSAFKAIPSEITGAAYPSSSVSAQKKSQYVFVSI